MLGSWMCQSPQSSKDGGNSQEKRLRRKKEQMRLGMIVIEICIFLYLATVQLRAGDKLHLYVMNIERRKEISIYTDREGRWVKQQEREGQMYTVCNKKM